MKCPKCNSNIPRKTPTCQNCDYEITKVDKIKHRKKIFLKILFLFVIISVVNFTFVSVNREMAIALILLLNFVVIAIIIFCKMRGLSKKGWRVIVAKVVWVVILSLMAILYVSDAPAIKDDYTVADLRSAPADCNPSYDILMSIAESYQVATYYKEDNSPLIGLTIEDVNTIKIINGEMKNIDRIEITELLLAHQNQILSIWEKAQKGRDAIKKLNSFEEIADLEKPRSILSDEEQLSYIRNLRSISHLFALYIHSQTAQGNIDQAIDELVVLSSVFRKLSITARSTVTKLVCIAGNAICIKAANFVANDSKTTKAQLVRLVKHFPDFSKEQLSLRNAFLFEYLSMQVTFCDFIFFKTKNHYMMKRNSANRFMLNHIISQMKFAGDASQREIKMQELSVWPGIVPDSLNVQIDENIKIPFVYMFYNPAGAAIAITLAPISTERICEIRIKLQIYQDMLDIVLNKRLGREFSLKARAYGDEYIVDVEGKKIFSPGPDGIENTDDDIKLNIAPEVLGWGN